MDWQLDSIDTLLSALTVLNLLVVSLLYVRRMLRLGRPVWWEGSSTTYSIPV